MPAPIGGRTKSPAGSRHVRKKQFHMQNGRWRILLKMRKLQINIIQHCVMIRERLHPFLEIGDDAVLPAGFLSAMEEGIRKGLNDLPARPMGVRGNELERISQCQGLYDEPGMLKPAPTQIRRIAGSKIRLTILMLGGGPEIRSKTQALFHMHSLDHVVEEMIEWAIPQVEALGCQPCTLSFGLGRTAFEASSLSLEAMKEGCYDVQSELEKRITDAVNSRGIGPIGLAVPVPY